MKTMKGDIIDLVKRGQFNVLVQGCNCWCRMGSGVALQIKENFPEAWEADRNTIKGHPNKLGTYSHVNVNGLLIVNGYTQFRYGYDGLLYTDYKAVRSVFRKLRFDLDFGPKNQKDIKICYPKIGCGLGGGDWEIVSNIINEELKEYDHTYVEYTK